MRKPQLHPADLWPVDPDTIMASATAGYEAPARVWAEDIRLAEEVEDCRRQLERMEDEQRLDRNRASRSGVQTA